MSAVTGEQLTEFCQNKCDGSGLNWVGIVFDDGSGLHITPGTWFVQIDYGTIDIETATFSDITRASRVSISAALSVSKETE